MNTLNKRVFRKIKEAKLQYIAIISVMIIGLMIYIAMNMGIYNFENSVNKYYKNNNYSDITVELMQIPENEVKSLLNIEGIKNVEGRISADILMKREDQKVDLKMISKKNNSKINKLFFLKGLNDFKRKYDIFVLEHFYEANNLNLNQKLDIQILGKEYPLEIKAKVGSPEFIYLMKDEQSILPDFKNFGVIYVSKDFAQDSLGLKNAYNEIIIDVKKGYNLDEIKDKIDNKLDRFGIKKIITKDDYLSNRVVREEISGGKQMANILPIMFLVIAGIILKVMISRLVKQDRMAIGVLKSLGYSNLKIIIHYSKFAVFIGVIGGILGILTGIYFSKILTDMYLEFYKVHYITYNYYINYLLGGIFLVITFSVLSGYFGARESLSISPSESMRKEAPKSGKRIYLEKFNFFKKFNFSTKMVWRNLMRDKKRLIFISFGIAVTLVVVTVPIHMMSIIPQMYEQQFEKFNLMDYKVKFKKPVSKNEVQNLKKEIKVNQIESQLTYPFEINYQWKEKSVNIIGIKKDTKMYEFLSPDKGKPFMKKNFIYVSDGLANNLGIKKGDIININNYIPNRDDINVEVTDIIKQSLGANIYMDISYFQDKLVDKQAINGVLIKSDKLDKKYLEKQKNISSVSSIQMMVDSFKEFMEITIASISVMVFLGFILGFAIIYNTTIMTINSRKLEFSSLSVLGMSKKEISSIVFKENLFITIIGIFIGIFASKRLSEVIVKSFSTEFYTLSGEILLSSYFKGIGLTVIFILIAQLAAFYRINKLNFIDALKERIS